MLITIGKIRYSILRALLGGHKRMWRKGSKRYTVSTLLFCNVDNSHKTYYVAFGSNSKQTSLQQAHFGQGISLILDSIAFT